MPGANAPAALRVRIENTQVSHHRFTGKRRHSLRDGVNGLLRALPGEPGFIATIPGAMRKHRHQVNASVGASGPHGFAVRQLLARLARTSVRRTLPRVRGDREPPLLMGQDGARA